MTAGHWMQIAALASALGLTGGAIAQNTAGTTSTHDRGSVSIYGMDTPSSGAIVTPEDKARGMGNDDERALNRSGDVNDDTSMLNGNTSNDDQLSINPGPSNDEESSVNPGPSKDEHMNVNASRPDVDEASPPYGAATSPGPMTNRDDTSMQDDENEASPPGTGSNVRPRDMGPGSVRGQ